MSLDEDAVLSPWLLDNMDKAVDIWNYHAGKKSKAAVIVDCDVDGYTSASIMELYLERLNSTFDIHAYLQK